MGGNSRRCNLASCCRGLFAARYTRGCRSPIGSSFCSFHRAATVRPDDLFESRRRPNKINRSGVHATEYKDQNSYLLEDVWVTIYGRDGNRNDNIHTRECGYQPKTGAVRCQGDVQIDIASANPPAGDADKTIQVTTRDLTFNRETGDASTPEPVAFTFPKGQGHAVGVIYSTQDSLIVLQRDVHLDLAASDRSNGLPVNVTGGSLEVRRDERKVVLSAP